MQLSACKLSAYVLTIINGDMGHNAVTNLWASTAIPHSIGKRKLQGKVSRYSTEAMNDLGPVDLARGRVAYLQYNLKKF